MKPKRFNQSQGRMEPPFVPMSTFVIVKCLDNLNDYLLVNPSIRRLADVSLVLQGDGGGGLAYVGTGNSLCNWRREGREGDKRREKRR